MYDLAEHLKGLVPGFDYRLVPVAEEYGRYIEENKTWTGMVGELVYGVGIWIIVIQVSTRERGGGVTSYQYQYRDVPLE